MFHQTLSNRVIKASLFALSLTTAALTAAGGAAAQQEVGKNPYGGLHWSVAAPQGASWALECGIAPVTVRGIHMNRVNYTGTGPQRGRLPGQDGGCKLIKTGGAGPVGLALVKNGQPTAAGSNGTAPAVVNVF